MAARESPREGAAGPGQSGLSALSSGPAPGSLQPLGPRGKEALEPRPPGVGLGLGTLRSTTLRRGVNAVSRTGSVAVEAGALFHLDGVRCIFRNNFQPDSHVPVPLGGEWPRVSSESRSLGCGYALYRPGQAQVQASIPLMFDPQTSPTAGGRLLCYWEASRSDKGSSHGGACHACRSAWRLGGSPDSEMLPRGPRRCRPP